MADEMTLHIETTLPIPFTVADGTGIEKGTLLKLTDPMTAIATSADNDLIAGVAAEEKIASDGRTKIAVYRRGIFRATASGSITVGDPLVSAAGDGVNRVATSATNTETVLGTALETATDQQTLLIELNPTSMQLA